MDQLPIIHVKRVDMYYHITSPFNNANHFMVIIFVSLKVAQSNFDFYIFICTVYYQPSFCTLICPSPSWDGINYTFENNNATEEKVDEDNDAINSTGDANLS